MKELQNDDQTIAIVLHVLFDVLKEGNYRNFNGIHTLLPEICFVFHPLIVQENSKSKEQLDEIYHWLKNATVNRYFVNEFGMYIEGQYPNFARKTSYDGLKKDVATQSVQDITGPFTLNHLKVYIIGDSGVGKTSFCECLHEGHVTTYPKRTPVADISFLSIMDNNQIEKMDGNFVRFTKVEDADDKAIDSMVLENDVPVNPTSGGTSSIRDIDKDQQQDEPSGIAQTWESWRNQQLPMPPEKSSFKYMESESICVEIWDCGGQDIYRQCHEFLLDDLSPVFILFSCIWDMDYILRRVKFWKRIIPNCSKRIVQVIGTHALSVPCEDRLQISEMFKSQEENILFIDNEKKRELDEKVRIGMVIG